MYAHRSLTYYFPSTVLLLLLGGSGHAQCLLGPNLCSDSVLTPDSAWRTI